ncbi:hypothetical protein ACLB2K_059620 [Fragaria x ananassa]
MIIWAIWMIGNTKVWDNEAKPASEVAPSILGWYAKYRKSANHLKLSCLELDSLTNKCIVDMSTDQDVESLGKHVKAAFGPSWKEELCDKRLLEGKVDPGSPAVLIISASSFRSIELLRIVFIASGTPNRIKKLIDIEALGLSRLSVIVLDVHPDVKGYSLLTLPQVSDEFWDLYKTYFHQ